MIASEQKVSAFHTLHKPGQPVVLFNVWDAGSAKAVVAAGAVAVATGSASVGGALGFGDGEGVPLDLVIANANRIVASVDTPVSLDFEGGYSVELEPLAENFTRVLEAGVVGCNVEDQIVGGKGLHSVEVHSARLRAMRKVALSLGVNAFINARTDVFLKAPRDSHNESLVDEAMARASAYASAGASGFFVPGLVNDALIARACERSPLPINVMVMPGVSSRARLAELGVARISHGPGPWRNMMSALTEAATIAMQ